MSRLLCAESVSYGSAHFCLSGSRSSSASWCGCRCIRHGEFVDRAARQQQRTFEVAPRRGVLYDRNLHELAMTVLVDSVYAVPSEMTDKDGTAAAARASGPHRPDGQLHNCIADRRRA